MSSLFAIPAHTSKPKAKKASAPKPEPEAESVSESGAVESDIKPGDEKPAPKSRRSKRVPKSS